MSKLVLLGGGGHCKSVLDSALRMKLFEQIVITDPDIPNGTEILSCTVAGTDDCLERLYQEDFDCAFITVGSIQVSPLREKLADKAAAIGFKFPIIQDPSAIVAESAAIGEGTFIGKNAVVNAGAIIGKHCIINTGAIIEHECLVGDFSHVSVGATLCGEATVGKNCMIGSRSIVIQCLTIGDKCVIGAGAVVNRNLPDSCKAVGVPVRII